MCGSLQHIQSINAISIAQIEELEGTLKRNTVYDSEQSMEVKFENFAWTNMVNKAALRWMDTLIRHIDPPAKHDGLLCRFWFFVFLLFV